MKGKPKEDNIQVSPKMTIFRQAQRGRYSGKPKEDDIQVSKEGDIQVSPRRTISARGGRYSGKSKEDNIC